jgi:hypothetical protein
MEGKEETSGEETEEEATIITRPTIHLHAIHSIEVPP